MDIETMKTPGLRKTCEKLQYALNSNNFYEAYQFYRSIFFRSKKDLKLASYLYDGCNQFLIKENHQIGIDMVRLLMETLLSCPNIDDLQWSAKICRLVKQIDPHLVERELLIKQFLQWVRSRKNEGLKIVAHRTLAQIYSDEHNYQATRYHYLLSGDGELCAKLLIQLQSKYGSNEEVDVFIVQTVLQYLCMKNSKAAVTVFINYTKLHPMIQKFRPPYSLPLLNFIWFLFKAIELGKLRIFVILCEQYEKTIKRDPCFVEYLERIGQLFFNAKAPLMTNENQTSSQTNSNVFNDIFQSFISDFNLSSMLSSRTSTNTSMNTNNIPNFSVPDID